MTVKELTQEQVNILGEKARNIAGNAAESSLPLMLRDLGKQIAETGDSKMQAVLRLGFELHESGDYVFDMDVEWTRKIKHKDAFASERINFDQPDLPGINDPPTPAAAKKSEPRQLNAAPRMLNAAPAGMVTAEADALVCLCGHIKGKHQDDGDGACADCTCEMFEMETRTNFDDCDEPANNGKHCGDCAYFGLDECSCREDKAGSEACGKFKHDDPDFHMAEDDDADAAETHESEAGELAKACKAWNAMAEAHPRADDTIELRACEARNAVKLLELDIMPLMVEADERGLLRVFRVLKGADGSYRGHVESVALGTKAECARQVRAFKGIPGAMFLGSEHLYGNKVNALFRIRDGNVVWITDALGSWRKGKPEEQDVKAWHERADALEG